MSIIKVLTQDRRGRGWETGWNRTGPEVALVDIPDDLSWQRLPTSVKDATIEYHQAIATARAKEEHAASEDGLLFTTNPLTVKAARWRGDQDSLDYLCDRLFHVKQTGHKSLTVTDTSTLYIRRRGATGPISLGYGLTGQAGSYDINPGDWVVVHDNGDITSHTDEDFFHLFTKTK